jgi:hypothetical protein
MAYPYNYYHDGIGEYILCDSRFPFADKGKTLLENYLESHNIKRIS